VRVLTFYILNTDGSTVFETAQSEGYNCNSVYSINGVRREEDKGMKGIREKK
jgi:hypothetical protein